jgi:glycine/D-amino acid oxidase-like deaminating enzyme/nitrite reductase/ring-hydroxylating ferredoxin subunit
MPEHESPWLAGVTPPSWPTLERDLEADYVVVGGGIAGLTVASRLHADGATVAVIEAERIGRGTTGHTTGKLTSQHGLTYRSQIERQGKDRARAYAEANQQAIEEIEDTVNRLGIDCSFERAPAYVYTCDRRRSSDIEAEHSAASELGLPASLTTDIDLPFPIDLALRFDHQAMFDVAPYLLALAQDLSSGTGLIFEKTRALGIEESRKGVTVQTTSGQVSASSAIVATLIPFLDRTGFFARMKPSRAYGVAARLRSDQITAMHINIDSPTRSTRPWKTDHGSGVVVVGEGHSVGHRKAKPERWEDLEEWTRRNFDVESFEYRWSAQDFEPVDQIPYVGRAPLMRRTYVVTGFRKWGLTNATAAAHIIADLLQGRPNDWLSVFDATRLGDFQGFAGMSVLNLQVASRFVRGRFGRFFAPSIAELELGEGSLIRADGRTVAAYRDPDGVVYSLSPTCTHLGCTVRWNQAERSWDCPCHGSRFATDGQILNGPATEPLERLEIEW